jgi:cytochrome P450
MTSSEFFYAPLISSWFAAEATLLIRKLFGIDAALTRWPTLWSVARSLWSVARSLSHLCLLPPGRLDFSESWRTDQLFFAKRAKGLGPIFKMILFARYTICLVGLKRAREFLLAHENVLRGEHTDLRGLFPKGAIRAMSGEDHQKYRRMFIQVLQATPLAFHENAIRGWLLDKLAALAKDHFGTVVPGPQLRLCLREMTTGIMLRILFGLTPDDSEFPVFVHNYRKFGPNAPVTIIGPDQADAFIEIRNQVLCLVDTIRRDRHARPPSFLKLMVERDELDETALGNLIYMCEGPNFDLYSLWRWIVKHLVTNPDYMKKVQSAPAPARTHLCEAIVLETLRLEQVEYLYRVTTSDISYQHYLIPKNAGVRVCLWEGHKDPNIFQDPFRFDPERFVGRTYPIEEYAPFGLDKRCCIASDFVVTLSAVFIETLLERFVVTLASDGPPKFGAFHWEPNPDFSIAVTRLE